MGLSKTPERAIQMVEAWLESGQEDRTGRLELYYLNAGYAEARLGKIEQSLTAIDTALNLGRRIANPCLIVQGLGLRAELSRASNPASPSEVGRDVIEQRELCRRHGLMTEASA
jgi:hypothetical protein